LTNYKSGSAWEYDEATDEYYLHLFATEQPDLNWDNPRVRFAVHQIMRYWLDKGVSGFRLDVINFISKNPDLPDAPVVNPDQRWQDGSLHYACGPKLHDYLQELGSILKDYNAFSVGEMPCVYDPSEIVKAVGSERNELGMVFQFEIVDLDNGPGGRFSPGTFSLSSLKSIVAKWQDFMYENDGWNALYLENHDQGRSIPRFTLAAPEYRAIAGKMLATFLGLQSGTVFIFQGQEIGMVNVPTSWDISYFRDIEFLNHWNETVQTYPDDLELHITTMKQAYLKSRDNGRTPMQWGPGRFAEFTSGDVPPWISVHDDYKVWNVAAQISDPESVFWYWAKVLKLRKTWADVFVYGKFALVDADNKNLFVYSRSFGEQIALVVLNFSETCVEWEPPKEALPVLARGKILLGNYVKGRSAVSPDTGKMTVRPFEGVVIVRN
jgi:glycosidase